jgi:surfactin synthase thioesterase subunit
VQLPGRQDRLDEPPPRGLADVLDELEGAWPWPPSAPVALYGHSMGALLAFELAHRLWAERDVRLSALFVSSHRAPHLARRDPPIAELPDARFLAAVRELGGTDGELLRDPELMRIALPALRADVSVCEQYVFKPRARLPCPIHAFGGEEDPGVTPADFAAWAELTERPAPAQLLPGGHFLGPGPRRLLLGRIEEELLGAASPVLVGAAARVPGRHGS